MEENWKLKRLEIEFQEWGESKGKYKGKITFKNDQSEYFEFNLVPELTQQYFELIAPQIIKNANELGNKLIESLDLNKEE